MANQSSARIKGDDYQHLITWLHILSLKKKNTDVLKVGVEDPQAGLVDDVTVYRSKSSTNSADFYQVKYHVDYRSQYTIASLLDNTKGTSLLEKFWDTWNKLKNNYHIDKIRLHLVSNWSINPSDEILSLASGEDGKLSPSFYASSKGSQIGKAKEKIRAALKTTLVELETFFKAIHFDLGKDCSKEFKERVAERMEALGLKHDEASLLISVGVVRNWVKAQTASIDLNELEKALKNAGLYLADEEEKSVTVYLTTVKDHKFDVPPDYVIDWRNYFEKQANTFGHELKNQDDWNNVLLPQLYDLEQKINSETKAHLIRARGFARLSAWIAFGYTFSEVSGYQIEVNQQDKLWLSSEKMTADFKVISENGEGDLIDATFDSVAVGISVTGSLSDDVRKHVNAYMEVKALLLLRPTKELGKDCLSCAGDATALVNQSKILIRDFVKRNSANKLLLYYFGPLSGACFLGNQLNAVCKEIQLMENIPGGDYTTSFILK